ncbi:protein BTG3-like isoform X2 [Alligator sinensis]|nr:protein BTG3-like isoform X2 [Alligator sinensis]
MREEVEAGARFLAQLLTRGVPGGTEELGAHLATALSQRYHSHWYPAQPARGQAYRCIRIEAGARADAALVGAAQAAGLDWAMLTLPPDLALWIDPGEVSCRLGEHNPPFRIGLLVTSDPETPEEPSASPTLSDMTSSVMSSEDEAPPPQRRPRPSRTPPRKPRAQACDVLYVPAPLWLPGPQPLVGFVPSLPPLTLLYLGGLGGAPKLSRPKKPSPERLRRLTHRTGRA